MNKYIHNWKISIAIIFTSLPSLRPVDCAPGWCLMSGLTPVFLPVWCTQPAPWHDTHLEPVPPRIPAQLLSGPRPLYIVTHITSQCPHHNHRNQPHPHHYPLVIKLSPCNKDYYSKWSDLNNLWMTWQHYWVTCLCYECFEPRYAVTAMCHMFIFPSYFILFICPIIQLQGFWRLHKWHQNRKHGTKCLWNTFITLPPSAHDIVVVTFHLEKSPPQAAVTTPAPGPG